MQCSVGGTTPGGAGVGREEGVWLEVWSIGQENGV